MTGLSIDEVSELMTLLDPAGSCSAVCDYVNSLDDVARASKFYAGATTTSYEKRKKDHNKVHLDLQGQKIQSFTSFCLASFAETAAICLSKITSKKKSLVDAGTDPTVMTARR